MSMISEIKDLQDEVREGYMPEKQTAPDFGEPWNEQTADMNKGVHWLNTEQFNRAVTCVNACASMADPSAEIEKLKECFARYIEVCTNLQECVQKHNIGLGGEKLDEIVCAEIQALREALSGRTVSCSQCNEAAKQIEAMQEAIKEAHDALDNCVEFIQDAQIIEAQWRWEPVKQSKAALAKLQPFIKP